ncbi:unnamed protein product, partial [Hapterophycus canaliculatus]
WESKGVPQALFFVAVTCLFVLFVCLIFYFLGRRGIECRSAPGKGGKEPRGSLVRRLSSVHAVLVGAQSGASRARASSPQPLTKFALGGVVCWVGRHVCSQAVTRSTRRLAGS